ncbi:MAG: DEAD/DEAH box helicase [Spirochaetia bacterium]|nr:DEAD/DEAH box helicase [Spirochaetia bacterium]
MTFESLGLSPRMLETLAKKGFEEPTPIQSLAIPRLMTQGNAIAAKARTGTGKTAAFGIPLIERLSEARSGAQARPVSAIILVPTRELALQVTEEISSLKYAENPRLACVYGGASMRDQLRKLAQGVDIVVGTPGRVKDHIERGTLDLAAVSFFILDEADEMLDMGFIEDIEFILDRAAKDARILLFSATLARPVLNIVRKRAGDIDIIEDTTETLPTELAEQVWIEVHERDKLEALSRIVDSEEEFYGIVFVSTKVEADKLAKSLGERGYDCEALHGDLSQEARERVLGKFRDKRISILVATDVAARGIDIEKLTHVINWSLPHDPESYLHRVGRTGRAGNSGTAITFVTPQEYRLLFRIRKISGTALKKGKVPDVEGVIAIKKDRIATRILARQEAEESDENIWLTLAKELLEKLPPEKALAFALAEGFSGQLDPGRYRELTEVSVDEAGVSRLFISAGKRDHMTPRSLVTIIKKLSNLPDRLINSIEVYDDFSFVSVPYKDAEKIIAEARRKGGFPQFSLAAPRGGARGRRDAPPQGSHRASAQQGTKARRVSAPRFGHADERPGTSKRKPRF